MTSALKWKAEVDEHDYDAAFSYLTVLLDKKRAKIIVAKLREAKIEYRRANDILRGCNRPALGLEDSGVRKNFDKTLAGEETSPVLLVSFRVGADIADGYHRVSWAYQVSPYLAVPLKIAYVDKALEILFVARVVRLVIAIARFPEKPYPAARVVA
jgi:hypothetical protein